MNKKELIRAISRELESSVSQEIITLVLNKAIEITNRTLETGEPVKWSGFGSLVIKEVFPQKLYSPKLGKYIMTRGGWKIVFKESGKKKRTRSA